jgi:serine/threonine-protein kinase RsbW
MNSLAAPFTFQHSIPSDLAEARRLQAEIQSALESASFAERDIFAIRLAVEEALVNAIKHGNGMDPSKRVHVNCRLCTERFEVQITDEGDGFNPDQVPDPTAPENLERPCGRGMLLMRHYMNEVAYDDSGRAVRMARVRNI